MFYSTSVMQLPSLHLVAEALPQADNQHQLCSDYCYSVLKDLMALKI